MMAPPNKKIMSPTSAFFVIFCTKRWGTNTNGEAQTQTVGEAQTQTVGEAQTQTVSPKHKRWDQNTNGESQTQTVSPKHKWWVQDSSRRVASISECNNKDMP